MNRAQPSFAVRSTHRLVETGSEAESSAPTTTPYYYNDNSHNSSRGFNAPQKGYTDTDSMRRQGSAQGMSIRTTDSSAEDFY